MARNWNPRTAARFDRYLDALATGTEADPAGLDPALTATADRLFRAAATSMPSPARAFRPGTAVAGSALGAPSRPRLSFGAGLARSFPAVTAVALAAVMLLGVIVTLSQRVPGTGTPGELHVYRVLPNNGQIVELDPATLADRATLPAPAGDDADSRGWNISDDGSVVLETVQEHGNPNAIVPPPTVYRFYDAVDGRQRGAVTDFTGGSAQLTPDGRFLVIESLGNYPISPQPAKLAATPPPRWFVYDTTAGALASIITATDRTPSPSPAIAFSPDGSKMYALLAPSEAAFPGPWAARLVAFDLRSGQEIGYVDLPEVRVGWWSTGQTTLPGACVVDDNGAPGTAPVTTDLLTFLIPGLTVSPDGATVAIVHAADDAVTFVDVGGLRAHAAVPLTTTRATSSLSVTCASDTLAVRVARYAPDGRALYVVGFDRRPEPAGNGTYDDLGVVRLDPASGASSVLVAGSGAKPVARTVLPLGADRLLVVSNGTMPSFVIDPNTTTAQVIDPATGSVLAERTFIASDVRVTSAAIEPTRYLSTPMATLAGLTALHVRAIGGDIASLRVVADGMVVLDGALPSNTSSQLITAKQIVITSSDPGYTIVAIEGQPEVLMLAATEEYPKSPPDQGGTATPTP